MSRRLGIAAALICATTLTAGCAPDPDPTPTPTGFTSQAEAFAAAEKTYRAYVNALNNVDLTDPATFEDVYKWETGEALADEKKSLTGMYANGWQVDGKTKIVDYATTRFQPDSATIVVARACVDISTVAVTDDAGHSRVSPDRPDRYAVELGFAAVPLSNSSVQIATISNIDDPSCTA